jgi:hypothetical protein
MFGEVVSDANAIDATPDYDIVECVLGGWHKYWIWMKTKCKDKL